MTEHFNPILYLSTEAVALLDNAEKPCCCDIFPPESLCFTCKARFLIMEELYSRSTVAEIAESYANNDRWRTGMNEMLPEVSSGGVPLDVDDNYDIDEYGYVKIDDGRWVPIEEIEKYIFDPIEIDSIINQYVNMADASYFGDASSHPTSEYY